MPSNGFIFNTLIADMQWLENIMNIRLENQKEGGIESLVPLPVLSGNEEENDPYKQLILKHKLEYAGRLALLLSLAPYVKRNLLNKLIKRDEKGLLEPDLGGILSLDHRVFKPTFQTLLFLLSGYDEGLKMKYIQQLHSQHTIFSENLLSTTGLSYDVNFIDQLLVPSSETLKYVLYGVPPQPTFSMEFPARYIQTDQHWDDLVLDEGTRKQIHEIIQWVKFGKELTAQEDFVRKMKKGFRSLFFGPSGTGKTMTASLISKETGRDAYRIDLSTVISKYVGETEKNLARIFDRAENKDWILFFDEADALFGKRTETKDAHDRFANQEVSYLLQRVEDFDGVVILSTNFKGNIDKAFLRRFHAVISFPMPSADLRYELWQKIIPDGFIYDQDIDFEHIAKKLELSGGEIMNAVRYCCLQAVAAKRKNITYEDLKESVKKEYSKKNKTMSL